MTTNIVDSDSNNLDTILSSPQAHSGFRRWRWIGIAVFALLMVGTYWFMSQGSKDSVTGFKTEALVQGDLTVTVSATGNLEPTTQVDIGSELSGTVTEVFVDNNDRVSKGQVLARLDLSPFEDTVARSQAAVAIAEANLAQANATVTEKQAIMARFVEVSRLSGGKVPSKTEMDTATADLARAKANLASSNASILEAKATLRSNQTNLNKANIKSPINGVVLERSVDPGQAVAASLQAVTLFTIAEDLSKMELKVDVDEADVGQVSAGQSAKFSVDAWPTRTFEAVITRVGFNATDNAGVISYPAVLSVDNSDLSLRPGMTATADITTIVRKAALLIPNAALRFTPTRPTAEARKSRGILSSLMPSRPGRNRNPKRSQETDSSSSAKVWIQTENGIHAIPITMGVSNGRVTEIVSDKLKAGDKVITEALGNQA